jgi:uncharacterized caspase-like protein
VHYITLKRVVKLLKLFSDNSFSPPSTLQLNLAWLIVACCLLVTLCAQAYEESPERYALVIGNTSYPSAPLVNPVNDARAIAKKLESQDFAVTLVLDADSDELSSAISLFYQGIESEKSLKRIVSMVYYAGHAMQIKHRNYLVPIDFSFADSKELYNGLFDVNELLENIPDIANMQNILIMDACRDNPFKDINGIDGEQINDGLAPMRAPVGTLIAYATEPGSVASDGEGENGLYTSHLLEHMGDKITIEEVFKKVRKGVAKESKKSQIPWEHSSLYEDVYINSPPNREVPELMSF